MTMNTHTKIYFSGEPSCQNIGTLLLVTVFVVWACETVNKKVSLGEIIKYLKHNAAVTKTS